MRNDNMKTQRVWCLDKIQQSLIYILQSSKQKVHLTQIYIGPI